MRSRRPHIGRSATGVPSHSDGLMEKDPFYRDQEAALPKLAQAIQRGDSAVLRSWRPAHTGQFEQAAFSSLDLPGLLGLRQ